MHGDNASPAALRDRFLITVSVCGRLPSLVEYVEQPLTAGLRDRAACVRRVAVLGWAKLHNLQPGSEIGGLVISSVCLLKKKQTKKEQKK